MTFIEYLIIQAVICFIIDLSGFIPSLEECLGRTLHYKVRIPKPFSCSLCLGFWVNLIVMLFTCPSLLSLFYISILSFLSKNITGILGYIQEFLVYLENLLYKILYIK